MEPVFPLDNSQNNLPFRLTSGLLQFKIKSSLSVLVVFPITVQHLHASAIRLTGANIKTGPKADQV